jgi:hypothetical protein
VDDEKHHGKNERMHTTQGLQALALRGPPSCCAKLVNAIPEFNRSSGMVETTKQSVRSEASMDPEQKKAEEERLHAIVKSFSKDAISGLKCEMVEHVRGSSVTAKFSLDKALTVLTIDYSPYREQKIMISLEDVDDVYEYDDVVQEVPELQIAARLGPRIAKEDRNKAIIVHHRAKDLPEPWICLLLSNEAEVERFATSMKILKLRALSLRAQAQAKGTSLSAV